MLHTILAVFCLALLFSYLAALRRPRGGGAPLTLALAPACSGWLLILEGLLRHNPEFLPESMRILLVSQFLLGPSWLLFSLSYGRGFSWKQTSALNKLLLSLAVVPLAFLLVLPPQSFYYQTDFSLEPLLFLEQRAFFFYLHLVLILLLAVGNLESTLRGSQHSDRWRIKLALVGAGVCIITPALFYSQGLLYRFLDMRYLPLRSFGLLLGLGLMLFAEWRRGSGAVVISRRVAFRSVAVIVAGLYLLGLGITREGARFFGRAVDSQMLIACVLLLGLGALLLLLSHSVRRKFSIWLQRNLYGEKYDYRGQWIDFSERLARAGDKESLIRAVLLGFCDTFGFVGALFLSPDNANPTRPVQAVYYEILAMDEEDLKTENIAPLLARPPAPLPASAAPESLAPYLQKAGACLLLPVHSADGPEGVLIMARPIDGKEEYDIEDYELMEAMGRQIGLCVRSFRLGDELVVAREMEALGRLGAFVLHDLKNQVYALSLLMDNARRFIARPEFQKDMLETLGNTVANMKILITQLNELPRESNLRLEPVDLHDLARRACGQVPGANMVLDGAHLTVTADAEQMGKVVTNLCLNAVEAGGDKPVRVEIAQEEVPVLRITDQGGGIAEKILRKGLFTPFNSTKERGMGIGLYHSRKIVEAHGGSILVENHPGRGCTFVVRFDGERRRAFSQAEEARSGA